MSGGTRRRGAYILGAYHRTNGAYIVMRGIVPHNSYFMFEGVSERFSALWKIIFFSFVRPDARASYASAVIRPRAFLLFWSIFAGLLLWCPENSAFVAKRQRAISPKYPHSEKVNKVLHIHRLRIKRIRRQSLFSHFSLDDATHAVVVDGKTLRLQG